MKLSDMCSQIVEFQVVRLYIANQMYVQTPFIYMLPVQLRVQLCVPVS